MPVEPHPPGEGAIESRHDVEDRCLAGAVGTDHREDLARRHGQVNVAQRGEATKADRQTRDLEERGRRRHGSDLIQSETGVKCPFSTRTQNPCFWVSWSGPIVIGGTIPESKPFMPSRATTRPSRVRGRPARLAPSAKSIPAR